MRLVLIDGVSEMEDERAALMQEAKEFVLIFTAILKKPRPTVTFCIFYFCIYLHLGIWFLDLPEKIKDPKIQDPNKFQI